MRGSTFALLMALFSFQMALALPAESQNILDTKVSIQLKGQSVEQALHQLHELTGIDFIYSSRPELYKKVHFKVQNRSLQYVMNLLSAQTGLAYDIISDKVVIHTRFQKSNDTDIQPVNVALITISGVVKDQLGNSLSGVSIQIVGSANGTITNEEGKYSMDVQPTDSLRFSSVGYETQTLPVRNRVDLNVVMEASEGSLNQVVVVGYGKQKKISLVGAQSTVSPLDLQLPVRNLSTALAGRLAGVIAVQRSGEPGFDDADIYIRGISTFNSALSKPLILVDGVPRPFADIDPEDIASFSILKDASATAIYGVRGANGVILITTKTGNPGRPQIRARYDEGVTTFTKLPQFANGVTFMHMANEALTSRGQSSQYTKAAMDATINHTDPELYPDVDWFKVLFNRTGHTRRANVNISGGSEKTTYYVGTSFYDEVGLFKRDNLAKYNTSISDKRFNITTNLSVKPTNTTTIKLGIQGYLSDANYPGTSTSTIFSNAFFNTPVSHPVKYDDGKVSDVLTSSLQNPYAELTQTGYSNQWKTQLMSNLRITQDLGFFLKGLSATSMISFDVYDFLSLHRTKTPDTWLATNRDSSGNLIFQQTGTGTEFLDYTRSNQGSRTIYTETALNYNNRFGNNDVGAMILFNQSDMINTVAADFTTSLPYRFRGLAGRATYGYRDRYLLEFNFGYNGSENFAPAKRYGFFPSIGAGYVISEEPFFKPLKKAIQLAKFRFSYGKVGNSDITGRRFAYIATVDNTTGYEFGENMNNNYAGKDIGEYASDVTWETSKKTNLGLDLSMLNSSLDLQVDVFKEHRTGIFLRRSSLPAYVGVRNAPYGNVGIIDNKGIDASVTYSGNIGAFRFRLMGNLTFNRNKVIDDDLPPWAYPWLERKGLKVGQPFGYIALGLFKDSTEIMNTPKQTGDVRPGDIKFKDMNGDGKIDASDKYPIGSGSMPELVYGFGFTLNYKAFSISTLFQGSGNVDIYLNGEGLVPFQQGISRGNLFSNIEDRWAPDNPDTHSFYPRLSVGTVNDNYVESTWWTKNGRYLRLKTLEVAYNLPIRLLRKAHVKKASIFLQGVNVLTFSPFKMWDVELGNGRGATYPLTSTYSGGINFSF